MADPKAARLDHLAQEVGRIPDEDLRQLKPGAIIRLLWLTACGLWVYAAKELEDYFNGTNI